MKEFLHSIQSNFFFFFFFFFFQIQLRATFVITDLTFFFLFSNVEAISNTAAALLALKRRKEAEQFWFKAIKLRPSYFEAVEHLIGILCQDSRPRDAVKVIELVENALRVEDIKLAWDHLEDRPRGIDHLSFNADQGLMGLSLSSDPGSGYKIPTSENGRLVALIHAKGNMLYALGDNAGASRAFEEAISIVTGRRPDGISGLIRHILQVFARFILSQRKDPNGQLAPFETILLPPQVALRTKELVFPANGQLPGLREIPEYSQKAAINVASNSLLSLAKIYQDGMSSSGTVTRSTPGVQDILALYYLSLSLQPSPSTANNVGILLASVQQTVPQRYLAHSTQNISPIPGVVPGSGICLALAYYNYGLNLDDHHAHLYTNLGSLLKDIGQLNAAIRMYELAVNCDGNFDIALANLANAVKDQGRISDAIGYYRRAVKSSPEFAEAVCGLANALNSVCNWKGRGGVVFVDKKHDRWHVGEDGMIIDAREPGTITSGWIGRVVAIVEKQLRDGRSWGRGILQSNDVELLLSRKNLVGSILCDQNTQDLVVAAATSWIGQDWEGAKVVRMVERATRRLGWQMYQEKYVLKSSTPPVYQRPQLPASLAVPSAPTVLPFHTFTCPLTANQIRRISQRNGLRISCSTLKAPWLPSVIFEPPAPPQPYLKVGYVSSDFNNHPLAHLMQSVFGFHNPYRVKAICYATTPSDNSSHREQIQREAPVFYDASSWSVDRLVKQIVSDGIHILVNLNGYTRGARNEVFAARPAPIQMSFMGFAGTLGAEWCDYLLADSIAVPPSMLRPWRNNVDLLDQVKDNNYDDGDDSEWVYGENIIFAKETFFCCDHRQSAPDSQEPQLSWIEEQQRRKRMRKELFPDLPEDMVILGNFNQLYKARDYFCFFFFLPSLFPNFLNIYYFSFLFFFYFFNFQLIKIHLSNFFQIEPTTFRTWLRILQAIPKAILWLLRFPDLGETNLREIAEQWSSPSVAKRIIFTDVAPKNQHIARARVCDLFLDTPECNAHTTAADVLWSGTPLLTLPRYEYKMCSRMAASILRGALPRGAIGDQAGSELIATNDEDYEKKAIQLGNGLAGVLSGKWENCRLLELRRILYEGRWSSALFDTRRWVRDLEDAYEESWRKWVVGEGGDIWLRDIIKN
jgi:predicted O-linked N-acetylglucosamine transferase (SPINDLY family)